MVIDIQCSCCGNHENLENSIDATVEKIKSGWGSYGSALYCPKCSKEWKNRNGERPMGDERNTFLVITNLFFSAMESEGE